MEVVEVEIRMKKIYIEDPYSPKEPFGYEVTDWESSFSHSTFSRTSSWSPISTKQRQKIEKKTAKKHRGEDRTLPSKLCTNNYNVALELEGSEMKQLIHAFYYIIYVLWTTSLILTPVLACSYSYPRLGKDECLVLQDIEPV